jgi:hypothetical protein
MTWTTVTVLGHLVGCCCGSCLAMRETQKARAAHIHATWEGLTREDIDGPHSAEL